MICRGLFVKVMGANRMHDFRVLSASCNKVCTDHRMSTFLHVVHGFANIMKHTHATSAFDIHSNFGSHKACNPADFATMEILILRERITIA
ncbi:hypothetical protein D3C72_2088710 [compost metagenome]